MTITTPVAVPAITRVPRVRTYAMTPPVHFTVEYAINPWMDPMVPVDTERAISQWLRLREVYETLWSS